MTSLSLEITIGILKIFSFVVPVLVSVALLVYLERKETNTGTTKLNIFKMKSSRSCSIKKGTKRCRALWYITKLCRCLKTTYQRELTTFKF